MFSQSALAIDVDSVKLSLLQRLDIFCCSFYHPVQQHVTSQLKQHVHPLLPGPEVANRGRAAVNRGRAAAMQIADGRWPSQSTGGGDSIDAAAATQSHTQDGR
ncbi:hypothetical protein PVAP13_7KG133355 [Panicum virgatum]|uniref:Uncharacterized protein n=1 Tax=Panicum virgatum TaxID=38727 RepID=A0A8T0QM25_PANVG|nr:hypothetical protein PVAP13_7KG133355 [Panicum virgatum]